MKTITKSLGILAIANTPKLTSTVNGGYRKLYLLSFTLMAVLFLQNFSVKAQGSNPDSTIPMVKLIDMTGSGFDRMYTDYESRTRQIYFYHKGITTLNGKDITPGGNVMFYDTVARKAVIVEALRYAKHVTKYENKLFYVLDTVNVYSYDLTTGVVEFLLKANDQIINFSVEADGKILVNAKSEGSSSLPYAIGSVSRVAIFNTKDSNIENITNAANVYQAVIIGNTVVYAESAYWFNTPGTGPAFRLNIYDRATGKTYSRTDFNALGLFIKTSDSTFLITYDPVGGGASRLSLVNTNKDLHDGTFDKEDVLELAMFLAPPIVGTNGLDNPMSPEKYFMNSEVVFSGEWYVKNLRTGIEVNRASDETYVMNLSTFEEKYVGKIANPWPLARFNFANRVDGRIIMFDPFKGTPYTNKVYGASTSSVKNTKIAGLSVYPNPAVDGFVTIDVPANADVEVYSVTGQLTFSQKVFSGTQIPVNSGINIVKVKIDNSVQTVKVIGR